MGTWRSVKCDTNSLFLACAMILADRFADEYNDLQGHLLMPIQLSSKQAPKMTFRRPFVWTVSNMACSYGR